MVRSFRDRAIQNKQGVVGLAPTMEGLDFAHAGQKADRRERQMPPWVSCGGSIVPHFDRPTRTVGDYHLVDNRDPLLFKTTDFADRTRIDGAAQGHPLDYTLPIAGPASSRRSSRERHGLLLFANDGQQDAVQDKLPAAPGTGLSRRSGRSRDRDLRPGPDPADLAAESRVTNQQAERQLYKTRPGLRRPRVAAQLVFHFARRRLSVKVEVWHRTTQASTQRIRVRWFK